MSNLDARFRSLWDTLMDTDDGMTEQAYNLLCELGLEIDPGFVREAVKRVEASNGRFYVKRDGEVTMDDIRQKVVEWNARYKALSKEVRLKDMEIAVYEAEVGSELLDVCGDDRNLALAVFEHPDNDGGWMMGDVAGWLRNQIGRRPLRRYPPCCRMCGCACPR